MLLALAVREPARGKRPQRRSFVVSEKYPVVAVIDDDPSLLGVLSRLLPTHGFDVELYSSPAEFLEGLTATRAICLVVDVQVDEGCGVEFVRRLAKRGITFPVIFIGNEATERLAMETTGCVASFRKPFSACLLVEALYDLVDSYSSRFSVT